MNKKKILWILVLIIFLIIIAVAVIFLQPRDNSQDNTVTAKQTTVENKTVSTDELEETGNIEQKFDLVDGILYSTTGQKEKAEIIVGDSYFDTTINDMYLNPQNYENKKIEIEGMYLANLPYTFVGRYTATSLCPYCSGGYSYVEYKFDGKITEDLQDEDTWIKLIGTWEKEKIVSSEDEDYYEDQDYYYLKVLNFEIMNERGQDTVKN